MLALPPFRLQDVGKDRGDIQKSATDVYKPTSLHHQVTSISHASAHGQNDAHHHGQGQGHQVPGRTSTKEPPDPRHPLMLLKIDETLLELRKQNIRRFGAGWLKPPGISKTFQGLEDERMEREEAEAMRLRELALEEQRIAVEQMEQEQAALQNQTDETADVAMDGDLEGTEADDDRRSGVHDLDADVPEAEDAEEWSDEDYTGAGDDPDEENANESAMHLSTQDPNVEERVAMPYPINDMDAEDGENDLDADIAEAASISSSSSIISEDASRYDDESQLAHSVMFPTAPEGEGDYDSSFEHSHIRTARDIVLAQQLLADRRVSDALAQQSDFINTRNPASSTIVHQGQSFNLENSTAQDGNLDELEGHSTIDEPSEVMAAEDVNDGTSILPRHLEVAGRRSTTRSFQTRDRQSSIAGTESLQVRPQVAAPLTASRRASRNQHPNHRLQTPAAPIRRSADHSSSMNAAGAPPSSTTGTTLGNYTANGGTNLLGGSVFGSSPLRTTMALHLDRDRSARPQESGADQRHTRSGIVRDQGQVQTPTGAGLRVLPGRGRPRVDENRTLI